MKKCLYTKCRKILKQREGEHDYFFKKRKTCNRTCGALYLKENSLGHFAIDSKVYFTKQNIAAAFNP
jgi:hypothetical protein